MKNKTWGLVDSFFDKYDIVDHHIKSYNDFVENRIQKIIDITEPITIENEKGNYTLRTGKIKIEKPFTKEADGSKSMIYPTEARLRNLNYSMIITVMKRKNWNLFILVNCLLCLNPASVIYMGSLIRN